MDWIENTCITSSMAWSVEYCCKEQKMRHIVQDKSSGLQREREGKTWMMNARLGFIHLERRRERVKENGKVVFG